MLRKTPPQTAQKKLKWELWDPGAMPGSLALLVGLGPDRARGPQAAAETGTLLGLPKQYERECQINMNTHSYAVSTRWIYVWHFSDAFA